MSVEEKVIAKYEEIKKKAEEIREKVANTEGGFGVAFEHCKLEAQLELLSELLGVSYEYKII